MPELNTLQHIYSARGPQIQKKKKKTGNTDTDYKCEYINK